MPIEIHELEILAPEPMSTGGEADAGTPGSAPRRPAPDPDEALRRWHREHRTREHRLLAD